MITCEESQKAFSPYLDGALTRAAGDALRLHLDACPVCRQRLDETRSVVRALSLLARPATPPNLSASIKDALIIERAARVASPPLTLAEQAARWLNTRLMPYSVGAIYSMILFVAVFGALRQQLRVLSNLADAAALESAQPDGAAASNAPGLYDVTRPLSPSLAVAARAPFTDESPTLNPRGALAALTLAPPSVGRPDDDDMIVVADVYGNGSASLAAVVTPPRNRHMIDDLQNALRENPAFVPASLDRRPQTMRVVFVLQKMNVADRAY
ncbi:MAG TPA: zf-HC2 domain-containing protein [Pyrinomonadaceae bacterium]|nr:zf-HC2 domain-containing protein [Pyrinomonadaceae bacterium]